MRPFLQQAPMVTAETLRVQQGSWGQAERVVAIRLLDRVLELRAATVLLALIIRMRDIQAYIKFVRTNY